MFIVKVEVLKLDLQAPPHVVLIRVIAVHLGCTLPFSFLAEAVVVSLSARQPPSPSPSPSLPLLVLHQPLAPRPLNCLATLFKSDTTTTFIRVGVRSAWIYPPGWVLLPTARAARTSRTS